MPKSSATTKGGGSSVSPATTVVSETTASQSPVVGTSLLYARADHTHGTPAAGAGFGVTRINGNSGAAGADLTLQKLSANATTNSTTTLATVMTTTELAAGVWRFKYSIIYQSAATTTGVDFAIGFTGTASRYVATTHFASAGGAAATGAADQIASNTATLIEGKAQRTLSGKVGATLSVDTVNADMHYVIGGQLTVTATGNLTLQHASEVAAASTVQIGTCLELMYIGA